MGNLLDNAMDAAESANDPQIRLSIAESLRACEFRISNNGPLIPEDMRENIFEAGVSTKGEGHGMGLNIVRQRLNELGGVITLLSDPNETTFSVLLPRKTAGR
jgi:sensor histidine kinase regulating citrate/malate metabolism